MAAKKKQAPESTGTARIEYVFLDEVKKWDRNPRLHDDPAIERSIKRYGFINPPILDENTGRLVAGHGRTGSLETMHAAGDPPPKNIQVGAGGRWLVPVIRGISFASVSEAEAYLIADNRITELGSWDMDALRNIVRDLSDEGLEMDALGWSEASLAKLLEPEPAKKERVKPAGAGLKADLSGAASARLIPIYLGADTYQPTVDRMRAVQDQHRLSDYTALLLFLLDHFEGTQQFARPLASEGAADPFAVPE
jgi:hypothetical protein